MTQVDQYNPPPNPAKITDSRAADYIAKFGGESWELDALTPQTLSAIVRSNVESLRDDQIWQASVDQESHQKKVLEWISGNFREVERLAAGIGSDHTDHCDGCEDCDPDNQSGWM